MLDFRDHVCYNTPVRSCGGMADALDSGSSVRKNVWVQLPPAASLLKVPNPLISVGFGDFSFCKFLVNNRSRIIHFICKSRISQEFSVHSRFRKESAHVICDLKLLRLIGPSVDIQSGGDIRMS